MNLNIAFLQTDLIWQAPEKNRENIQKKVNHIDNADLIVFPEMFTTGFSMAPMDYAETMDGETVHWMQALASEKQAVITGSIMLKTPSGYVNRLLWITPEGTVSFYDKHHLFTFANENKYYLPGQQQVRFELHGWRIAPYICFDLRFPVWSRNQASSPYDLALYVANWPASRSMQWQALLKARAIENQAYVLGVNRVGADGNDILYSGDSQLIGPLGDVFIHLHQIEQVAQISLNKKDLDETRKKFPFLQEADSFHLI
jgi:predicted amidohydrolase